jgi:hypothetical protein
VGAGGDFGKSSGAIRDSRCDADSEAKKEKGGTEPGNCSQSIESKASACDRADDPSRRNGDTGYAGTKENSCKKADGSGRAT